MNNGARSLFLKWLDKLSRHGRVSISIDGKARFYIFMNRNSSLKRSQISRGTKSLRRSSMVRVPGTGRTLKAKPESAAQRKFKREVRERDNWTCQFPGCGYYSKHIDVHHIAKRSQRPDLKLTVSNGICLCRQHHQFTDTHHDEAVSMGLLNLETYELARRVA